MTRVGTTEEDELRSEDDKMHGRELGFIPSFATVLDVYHDVRLPCTRSLLSSAVWGGSPLQSKARSHSGHMSYLGRYIFHLGSCVP
jgi:hypothetical protein